MKVLRSSLAPLLFVPALFIAVLRSGTLPAPLARTEIPEEPFVRSACTWACHNHGCKHQPKLPLVLTGDKYVFGWAVRTLHRWGNALSPHDSFFGYGLVNLVVFCAAWPGAMFAMWCFGLRTRAARRGLAHGRRA